MAATDSPDVRTYNPNGDDEETTMLKEKLLADVAKIEANEPTMVHFNVNNRV